ncbi:tyrosine-type recombinase/integrase [Leekyejoonella antrihumi]|uniref:Site-specific integrase n=1 Tax=Leekyejoonella antrihumi TaxID=1660198 RepID=A0A563E1I5_9MICO|nr:site-specific integrase [Leekyejoonella antrihumi]TWP36400.1 site-specific integrase [Leekyejoonella antrihumi]
MNVDDVWTVKGPDGKKRKTSRYGTGLRWRARWRESDGSARSKSYRTRDAAEVFLAQLKVAPSQRDTADLTGVWLTVWFQTKAGLAPTSVADYESILRVHVRPRWGMVPLEDIRHSDVLAWSAGLPLSASRVSRAVLILSQAVDLAVRDGVLIGNPVDGVTVRKTKKRDAAFLSADQVRVLLDVAGTDRPLVHLAVTTGMRFGEIAGARVGDLDVRRRRLRVARTLSTVGGKKVAQDRTKGGRARDVPLTATVTAELAAICDGRPADDPLFVTTRGHSWSHGSWTRKWARVKAKAGAPAALHFHDLRHTAASMAIGSGADVKQVQAMLGHATATMTLDLYGHLWNDDLTDVADRIEGLLEPVPGHVSAGSSR